MAKKTVKYNAKEVHITRSVVGLFLFLALILSVWGVRKLHLMTGWAIFADVAVFAALTVYVGILKNKQKRAGVLFEHSVWAMDFWFYLCCAALASHSILLISLPVDWWIYTTPIAWLLLAEMYVLYVTTWDQEKDFRYYGWLCAAIGIGILLNYQTYYNAMQNFVTFRFFDQKIAFAIGYVGLVLLALAIWYFGKKKGYTVWKYESLLGIFGLYWLVLQLGWLSGFLSSLIFGALTLIHFILLRILRQIKVI